MDGNEKIEELTIEQLQEQNEKLKKEVELQKINVEELSVTNQHLITATWRERELKEELAETKELVEKQNKNISESIDYSKKIQQAIIPTNESIKANFSDSFIYYKPKDVVSGDFPWYFKKGDAVYFAAVDCTGHGVPGAMLSIVGSLLLNNILHTEQELGPAAILNQLHESVKTTLNQEEGSNSKDGMDIGLCKINLKTHEFQYAGAHRPCLIMQAGEFVEIKGSRLGIGGIRYKPGKVFTETALQLAKGDSVYVFSDGLPDQMGVIEGEEEKLGMKPIRALIKENHQEEMGKIRVKVNQLYSGWKKDFIQLDDVLMIGVKV